MTAARWFVRCVRCLGVAAVDGRPAPNMRCTCGGRVRVMGKVTPTGRLQGERLEVPCDSRCTNALGPSCDCSCRGQNHGTHRLVVVHYDAGGVPKADIPGDLVQAERLERELQPWIDEIDRYRGVGWLPADQWHRKRAISMYLAELYSRNSWRGRWEVLERMRRALGQPLQHR